MQNVTPFLPQEIDSESVNPDYLYRGSARFHPRALLTAQQAMEIYSHRFPSFRGKVAMQARKYHVSPKTIRDILNRRTWTKDTRHMWAEDEQPSIRFPKTKTTDRRVGAKSLYQTDGAAPADLAGNHQANQSLDDRFGRCELPFDEWSNSNSCDDSDALTLSRAVTTSPFPMDLHPTPPSEPMPNRHQPGMYAAVAWTPALFLPEACDLGSADAGTGDDPFHFDWPNW